jgi:hypothetical protein
MLNDQPSHHTGGFETRFHHAVFHSSFTFIAFFSLCIVQKKKQVMANATGIYRQSAHDFPAAIKDEEKAPMGRIQ